MYSIFKTISFSLLVFFGGDVNAENFKPTSNIWYSNGLLKLLNISNNHKRVLILVGKSHFRPFMNGLMPLTK